MSVDVVAGSNSATRKGSAAAPHQLLPFLFRGEEPPLPPNVESLAAAMLQVEASRTAALKAQLDQSWKDVEATMELNKARALSISAELPNQLKAVWRSNFWDDTSLRETFGLSSILDAELGEGDGAFGDGASTTATTSSALSRTSLASTTKVRGRPEAITVKRSYMLSRAQNGGVPGGSHGSSAAAVVTGNPFKMTDSELMDPMTSYAPIRRLFAPLLRNREAFPVECTILLNELRDFQKQLAPLEAEMEQSMFNLPLHLPFRGVATYIQRTLGVAVNGAAMEKGFEEEHRPIFDDLRAQYRSIMDIGASGSAAGGAAGGAATQPVLTTGKESDAMWGILRREAQLREQLQPRCAKLVADAIDIEQRMAAILVPAQSAAVDETNACLARIRDEARSFTHEALSIVRRIAEIRAEGQAAFEADSESLAERMKSSTYQLAQSREAQEKCARRVREAVKELHKEQDRYERLVTAHVDIALKQQQVEAAFAQFRQACDSRTQLLRDAERTCHGLDALVERVSGAASKILGECEKHVKRILGEETFRKVRVSKREVENAMEWYRCVGDLSALHQQRYDSILSRVGDSWHLNYLLDSEKTAAANALAQCRTELAKVDHAWHGVGRDLAAFAIPIPSLSRIDKDPVVVEARAWMSALDAPHRGRVRKTADPIETLPQQSPESQLPPLPSPRQRPANTQTPRPPPRALNAGVPGSTTVTPSVMTTPRTGGRGTAASGAARQLIMTGTTGNGRDVD